MKNDKITLAHGSGGKLTHELIRQLFLPNFSNEALSQLGDSAILQFNGARLAFTTDSYVVKPLFFPGGDIGRLAVSGTINDLAVVGAKPMFLSAGFIIEEGFEMSLLEKVVNSMKETAAVAGVEIVTGDTKVVERGSVDNLYINTCGIGVVNNGVNLSISRIEIGDKIIISGTIADHGLAVISERESLGFSPSIKSDCAPLSGLIGRLINSGANIKFMRDPTRGGLATTLNEIVNTKKYGILINEQNIPINNNVRALCEILGYDPLYIANEGKVVIVASANDAAKVCDILKEDDLGKDAEIIGEALKEPQGKVCLKTVIGGTRIIDMLVGDQLPRIC
ncbi:MAG: hydrogenase expression/formation protein HypE [Planctomycetes bacterium GWF2_39_10]|nr:MAG: hydrogenase expression/formation protein HypE [Planctomycetes bacterium GWA2_39_15]OHB43663.1 MAG: hydrogenase expression/formation protein HypE [Planctomycetes bacterium GWC2_39_26]OHB48454.1 MAG: hydrogenase expression/formation protein HypE [Planctomycetes bacterium GWF2_39_10]OHC00175.1 MAG: hydrogenase expression/formation protein HypE [Planctomycetes bacterium RIFCSPLOWO2_12_FULL_39_13]